MWIEILLPVCCAAKGVATAEDAIIHDLWIGSYGGFAALAHTHLGHQCFTGAP